MKSTIKILITSHNFLVYVDFWLILIFTQPAFTCSKLTKKETLKYTVWNMFRVNNKDTRTTPMANWVNLWNQFASDHGVSCMNGLSKYVFCLCYKTCLLCNEILRWLPNLTTHDERNIFVLIYPWPYFQ